MILVDSRAQSGHMQVIRCDIKPRSVEKSIRSRNGTVSEKIQRVSIPLGPNFETSLYFLKAVV
jgi:hypothetical protein